MKTLILLYTLFSFIRTDGQNISPNTLSIDSFKKMPYVLNFEKNCRGRKAIQRADKNNVTFAFFQDISDSVSIFINDELSFSKYIIYDSNIVSSKFTGVSYTYNFSKSVNIVRIVYNSQKFYFELSLKKKYPLYTIYFSRNTMFVSGRKCIMVIK